MKRSIESTHRICTHRRERPVGCSRVIGPEFIVVCTVCSIISRGSRILLKDNWACSRQYHTTPARCSPRHGEFATHAIVTRCRPSCIGFFVVDQARLGGAVRPCRDEFGVWSVIRAPIPWPRGKQLAESSSMQMPCWPVRAFVSSRRGRRRPGYETERRAGWAGHRKK